MEQRALGVEQVGLIHGIDRAAHAGAFLGHLPYCCCRGFLVPGLDLGRGLGLQFEVILVQRGLRQVGLTQLGHQIRIDRPVIPLVLLGLQFGNLLLDALGVLHIHAHLTGQFRALAGAGYRADLFADLALGAGSLLGHCRGLAHRTSIKSENIALLAGGHAFGSHQIDRLHGVGGHQDGLAIVDHRDTQRLQAFAPGRRAAYREGRFIG